MKSFTDSAGQKWEISITLGLAMDIKEKYGLDLLQPEAEYEPGKSMIVALCIDEYLQANAIFEAISYQVEKSDCSEDEIRRRFDGDTLTAAQNAFFEELINFFLSRKRSERAAQVTRMVEAMRLAIRQETDRVNAVDVAVVIDGVISGSSPESLA